MIQADPLGEKRRLRQAMRRRLQQVTPGLAHSAGVRIAECLGELEIWHDVSRVVLFAPRSDEVDTSPARSRALADGKRVALPRMCDAGRLEFAEVGDGGLLRIGRFGIAEPPAEAPAVLLARGDLVLVPGLAFDRQGGRLGRGGGYYDRALSREPLDESRPILIGVGFSFQVVERVPMMDLDVCVDGVVSEVELAWADGAGPSRNR